MKILIIDDSKAMRLIMKRTLRQAGIECDVIEAANGKEGLDMVKAEAPTLVLSDWNMPEMTGIEMLRALRAGGDKTPFGFITTEGTPEMRQQALEGGALFVITKPFTAETFKEVITPVLA